MMIRNQPRRRGLISVVVLVTLLILGILGAAMLRVALARRTDSISRRCTWHVLNLTP